MHWENHITQDLIVIYNLEQCFSLVSFLILHVRLTVKNVINSSISFSAIVYGSKIKIFFRICEKVVFLLKFGSFSRNNQHATSSYRTVVIWFWPFLGLLFNFNISWGSIKICLLENDFVQIVQISPYNCQQNIFLGFTQNVDSYLKRALPKAVVYFRRSLPNQSILFTHCSSLFLTLIG